MTPEDEQRVRLSRAGRIGALARAIQLTQEQRSESARHAALARWGGKTPEQRSTERAKGRGTAS